LAATGRASVPGRRPPPPGPRPSGGRRPARQAPARSRRCPGHAQPRPRLPAARALLRRCHPALPPAACAAQHRRSQLATSFCSHRYAVIPWREACSELQDTAASHGLNLEHVRRTAAWSCCSPAARRRASPIALQSRRPVQAATVCLELVPPCGFCCLSSCPLLASLCLSWQADLVALPLLATSWPPCRLASCAFDLNVGSACCFPGVPRAARQPANAASDSAIHVHTGGGCCYDTEVLLVSGSTHGGRDVFWCLQPQRPLPARCGAHISHTLCLSGSITW